LGIAAFDLSPNLYDISPQIMGTLGGALFLKWDLEEWKKLASYTLTFSFF
jgi:hypothetical protein